MLPDWELIGVPHRIVIGDRGLKEGQLEYQGRRETVATAVELGQILPFMQSKLAN